MTTKAAPSPLVDDLVARFREIGETQMRDLPLYNDKLDVEAVGFEPIGEQWIGVLITPWFMNVMLLPREPVAVDMNAMGRPSHETLPSGETTFIWGGDEVTGMYKALSLHSPMETFKVQGQARAEARLRLAELLSAHRQRQDRRGERHELRHGADGSDVLELRRPSRARVRRRPGAHGQALLHEFGGVAFCSSR